MSKIIDFFQRDSQATSQPMGFRTSRTSAPVKRLALIAAVTPGAAITPAVGADAMLIRPGKTRLTAKTALAISKSLGDMPWGIADTGDKPVSVPGGCDFVVFPATARTDAAPRDEEVAKILEVESSMDDGLLRSVNDLPVDAVVILDSFEDAGPLVWHRLMILRHVTHLVSKPVIVPVPADICKDDLESLWEAGIEGIIVDADADRIAALHKTIVALPPRSAPKRDRAEALLPRTGGESGSVTEPDEEEEEEDDDWE
ncbi:MAG: hypothetical protein MUO19_06035 [Dehalococcoidales bacterium]|nr:hypothetical protein [Dehalococcoidales bacterium]